MRTIRGQSTGLNRKAIGLLLAPELGRHNPGAAIDVLDSACGADGILGVTEERTRAPKVFEQICVATARRV
ncbi:hypothetical protein [Streptosporangium sp. NPDC000509]|uniref:hypothetical protein n=1 Tax=Streptosporangium sp. NPDC000509 TaxID=3366186 RepID=UPI00367803D2